MLKTRLIPLLFIKNGLIVRSEQFSYHQNLGNVVNETERYSKWNADELIYIDITREGDYDLRRDDLKVASQKNIIDLLKQISKVCFMPLTFGGGIRSIEDIGLRIASGADKVTINTATYENPNLITTATKKFGAQCIVASIDYRILDNEPIVFTGHGTYNTKKNLFNHMADVEKRGAGEILINSIDRDGTAEGYDIQTVKKAVTLSSVPLIAAGGAGSFRDFRELAEATNVSAIAAGNIFHFTENSYLNAKKYLYQNNINVRI